MLSNDKNNSTIKYFQHYRFSALLTLLNNAQHYMSLHTYARLHSILLDNELKKALRGEQDRD